MRTSAFSRMALRRERAWGDLRLRAMDDLWRVKVSVVGGGDFEVWA